MTAHPPPLAQALISALVPRRTRDSVVGDLLEEYRQAQVPSRGEAGANAWYWRQALGFVWRVSVMPGLALGAGLTGRMLWDALAPVADTLARANITTVIAVSIFAIWGARLGHATGRIAAAVIMAVAASTIGCVVALATALGALGFATTVFNPSPEAWSGLREALDIPLPIIAMIGILVASAGAAIGRLFRGWPGSRASIRT